ncbi:MAG: hypothetical protein QME81_05210 [bacterium]|nr:hypothetical protein [bacterium]
MVVELWEGMSGVEIVLILLGQAAIWAACIGAGLAVVAHIHNKQMKESSEETQKLLDRMDRRREQH